MTHTREATMKQATCIVVALAWAAASAAARQPQSAEGSTAVFNAGRGGHNPAKKEPR